VTALPADVRASLLEAVLAERYPRLALGAIAARFDITLAVLQPVLQRAGYPDDAKMRKAVTQLRTEAQAADEARHAAYDDAPSPGAATAVVVPETPGLEPTGRLLVVRVDQLLPDPSNLRPEPDLEAEDIVELAVSIAESGLLQPIVARTHGDQLYVVAGHRRLAAVRRLGWTSVDAIVRGPMSEDDVLAAMLIENGQRKDLDAISEARGLARLRDAMSSPGRQATEAELARRIGRSAVFVASRMLLLQLDPASQERVRRGELGIAAAGSAIRQATGRTGQTGVDRNWHLGPRHPLSGPARARCEDAGHVTGRRLGGIACGECWEKAIRQDERDRAPDDEGDYCSRCGAYVENPHADDCPLALEASA
jgi:ParB family chromosome partitioning protein